MVRTLPPDVTHAQVKAAWAALQLELGWDGRDCRNRLDDSRG